jgi:hypothetical protein
VNDFNLFIKNKEKKMNRRKFLGSSLATVAAVSVGNSISAGGNLGLSSV